MKNVTAQTWPDNAPPICDRTGDWAFESPGAAQKFFALHCAEGISIEGITVCQSCEAWHVKSHMRELSGASSNSGTRHATIKLPPSAGVTGRRLSANDTIKYKSLKDQPRRSPELLTSSEVQAESNTELFEG